MLQNESKNLEPDQDTTLLKSRVINGSTVQAASKGSVQSLKAFGGKYSDLPVYSYQSKKDKAFTKETLDFFKAHNVVQNTIELNSKYKEYPLANKP